MAPPERLTPDEDLPFSFSIRNPLRHCGDGHTIRQFHVHSSSCRPRLLLAEIDGPRTEATLPLAIVETTFESQQS